MLRRKTRRTSDINDRVFRVEGKNLRAGYAVNNIQIRRRAVHPHLVITKYLSNKIVAQIQANNFHQIPADQTVVHQQLQVAIAVTKQRRYRVSAPAKPGVTVHFTERFLHQLHFRHQRF